MDHSPTVRSTATHNIWLLAVRYRLISRFIFALKNPLKHAPNTHWFEGWQLVCRICRPRRRLFYGNNFLKRLSFHTSVEIKHSVAHLRQKALCTAQCMDVLTRAGTLFPPPPPQFKPQWTRRCDRRLFTLIHLSTFSGCLWLKKEIIMCTMGE